MLLNRSYRHCSGLQVPADMSVYCIAFLRIWRRVVVLREVILDA